MAGNEAMEQNPALPKRLPDLSPRMRLFLAGVRDSEIANLEQIANLDQEEREKFDYLIKRFTKADFETMSDSLENLRTMKRFGRFGMWFFGFIVAGAGAAAAVKVFFTAGAPKG